MQSSKLQFWTTTFHFSLFTFHSRRRRAGFTLIELLVALAVFVILALFITQALLSVLESRSKAEVAKNVRQEADYATLVIERNLRSALSASCTSSTKLDYVDPDRVATSFSCLDGGDPRLASGSARLTTSAVSLTNCSFTCSPAINPTQVIFSFTVTQRQATARPAEKASLSVSSRVQLRNQ